MEWLTEKLLWLWNNPEVTWSGAGITGLGVLYFLTSKLFVPRLRRESTSAVSNTFTNSGGGDQNVAQGDHPIGKQENRHQASKGDHNVFSQTGDVRYEAHHHYYDRTPDGIPLQRPKQADHLVGREELLNDVLDTLQPGKVVTLCGPGGIGKTALASRIAWELSPDGKPPTLFPDGLLFFS
ncbi:MAG: ATP-binding protein, partial [Chloroflexi bacterium]|nr:ATP-binding protein [Chloroflexota bacterium]